MIYPTEADLLAELGKATVLVEQNEKVDQQDWSTIHQARCLVEVDTDAGVSTERQTQPYYVLASEARLAKPISAVRDYLILKAELADPSYGGLAVDDTIAALKAKTATGQKTVTFVTLAAAIGLDRMLAVQAQLEADAVGGEIVKLLRGPGVEAASPEYTRQVDYVASATDLTADESATAKALAERPWLAAKGISLRRYMVENIVGA